MNYKFILIFLIYHFNSGSEATSCYSANQRPVACEPAIENLAQHKPVSVDNSCGRNGPEKICTKRPGHFDEVCEICDHGITSQKHSSELTNDDHERGKETCWFSEALSIGGKSNRANVTIDLKKRSLVSYVTLELCGDNPSGIIIYKKSFENEDWIPWQYFADNCREVFGLEEATTEDEVSIRYINRLKPVCSNLGKSIEYGNGALRLLPFNPTLGRRFQPILTNEEQEWLTASSVRFSYVVVPRQTVDNYLMKLSEVESPVHVGASNIVIGGKPLCNGHAHRLLPGNEGVPACDCQHNTAGADCERCDERFNDQPWTPALFGKVSPCKRCECNNHADTCSFDIGTYLQTDRKHGSKCMGCRDNTTGPQCDKCSVGFYRDFKYPIYHKKACAECTCHSIGSYLDRSCDAATGKCHCKPGVIGDTCNQCAHGYRQTSSRDLPCKKVALRSMVKRGNRKCPTCNHSPKKINFKKYCHKPINLKVSVLNQENRGQWIRFHLAVEDMWIHQNPNNKLPVDDNQTIKVWLRKELLDCKCVSLKFDRSYVIMTNMKTKPFMGNEELLISEKSVVEEWTRGFSEVFPLFQQAESEGRCDRFRRQKRFSRRRRVAPNYDQYASFQQ